MIQTCPCCHGKGHLAIFDEQYGSMYHAACCHCEGTGTVPLETTTHVPNDFTITIADNLKHNELTRDQKRAHLKAAYKHMTDDEINQLLDRIYHG